jgi:copper(I)-binding protein
VVRPLCARPFAGVIFAGIATVVLLGGCGQVGSQAREHSSTAGVNGDVGRIAVRNAQITITDTDTGVLALTVFNEGDASDTLANVTSKAFSGVRFPSSTVLAKTDAQETDPSVGGDAEAGFASTGSASNVALPTTGGVFLNTDATAIHLTGVTGSHLVGSTIAIQLNFTDAGTLTLDVPVVDSDVPPPVSDSSYTSPPAAGTDSGGE